MGRPGLAQPRLWIRTPYRFLTNALQIGTTHFGKTLVGVMEWPNRAGGSAAKGAWRAACQNRALHKNRQTHRKHPMDVEHINAIGYSLADLTRRTQELRGYL